MNKVVFIAGVLAVCVVGGLFFCAGLFTGANVSSDKKNNTVLIDAKNEKTSVIDKIYNMLPGKKASKKQNHDVGENREEEPSDNSGSNISIDNLLNEIVSSHETNDQCLIDDVKATEKEQIVMNQTRRYLVFVGYFPADIAEEISQLMMAKGYPMHIQKSGITGEDSFLFCGPFRKKNNANSLVTWLHDNGFVNAKLVSHKLQQSEDMNLDELDTQDILPLNSEGNRKSRRVNRARKPKRVKVENQESEEQETPQEENTEQVENDEVQQTNQPASDISDANAQGGAAEEQVEEHTDETITRATEEAVEEAAPRKQPIRFRRRSA